jgi:hypothetical protein
LTRAGFTVFIVATMGFVAMPWERFFQFNTSSNSGDDATSISLMRFDGTRGVRMQVSNASTWVVQADVGMLPGTDFLAPNGARQVYAVTLRNFSPLRITFFRNNVIWAELSYPTQFATRTTMFNWIGSQGTTAADFRLHHVEMYNLNLSNDQIIARINQLKSTWGLLQPRS